MSVNINIPAQDKSPSSFELRIDKDGVDIYADNEEYERINITTIDGILNIEVWSTFQDTFRAAVVTIDLNGRVTVEGP